MIVCCLSVFALNLSILIGFFEIICFGLGVVVVVAQELEEVIYKLEGWWSDPQLVQSVCRNIVGRDTELCVGAFI